MERELWTWLMRAIDDVARTRPDTAYHTYRTALIVRVYLWAVLHHRPTVWACDRRHWDQAHRPRQLPSQSTMSRRLRSPAVQAFLEAMGRRLVGRIKPAWTLLKLIDGKPLTVANPSGDRDATWGHAAGKQARGYKLHTIYDGSPMPVAWQVQPLNVGEKHVARDLVPQLQGTGYLVGDTNYHASDLFELAAQHEHRLVAPRQRPRTGLGHRRQSPHRLHCLDMLEADPTDRARSTFAAHLMRCRRWIEGRFGQLVSRLTCLPPWVRRQHRVRLYVHVHLLIHAARIRTNLA